MGTLADKLQYLKGTKDAIMNAIIEKGVEITSSDTFRSYADKIAQISGSKATNVITENVSVRPTVRDVMKTKTRINAYSLVTSSNVTIGSDVSIQGDLATFSGSQEKNLINLNMDYFLHKSGNTFSNSLYLKVKYVNNNSYNPCFGIYSNGGGNGVWFYNGRIGLTYSANDEHAFAPTPDANGYVYVKLTADQPSIQDYRLTVTVHNNGSYTDAGTFLGYITNLSTASIADIGGRRGDTYFHSQIDISNSYFGTLNDDNSRVLNKIYVINNGIVQ